ncbi:Ulp1 protease family [Hirschfeldia incana]|nr:Ulp1 protease family [Hirschfeldia incana]
MPKMLKVAVVDSLLDEEPLEGLDVENVIYSDEEEDPRVDNLVDGIRRKTPYTYDSFQGGLKHVDVVCMRHSSKRSGKSKKSYVPMSNGECSDASYIAAIVIEKIQPQFDYLDKYVKGACSTMAEMEGSILTKVESVLSKFTEDLSHSVKEMVYALCKDNITTEEVPKNVHHEVGNADSRQGNEVVPVGDVNASTIRNVLTHLSEYSTPPRSIPVNEGENLTPTNRVDGGSGYDCGNTAPEYCAQSATSENRARQLSLGQSLEKHNTPVFNLGEEPSFSLGLTQEEQSAAVGKCVGTEGPLPDSLGSNIEAGNIDAHQFSRKSKRQKTVPLRLVETYECGPHILTLYRKAQKFIFLLDDMTDMERKFEKLASIQNKNSVVDVAGIAASVKEILFIVERKRNYSAKIVDIIGRVMRAGMLSQIRCNGGRSSVLLETKFVSSVIRTYPRFLKSTSKEVYNFPTVLREVFPEKDDPMPHTRRYYFPFNVGNKHWVGICFDAECGHIIILDCLSSLHKDAAIEKYITPFVQMLPYLARYACQDSGENPVLQCFDVFRPKSVAQVTKSCDSGLMSLILMATHALYGLDACKTIKPELLTDEAKRAAILAYEFKETL